MGFKGNFGGLLLMIAFHSEIVFIVEFSFNLRNIDIILSVERVQERKGEG